MKNFIKGMLFITLIIPFSDGVISMFNQGVEYICTKIAVKTYEEKQKIQPEEEEQHTCAIGFHVPSEEEYDDDEEEE